MKDQLHDDLLMEQLVTMHGYNESTLKYVVRNPLRIQQHPTRYGPPPMQHDATHAMGSRSTTTVVMC